MTKIRIAKIAGIAAGASLFLGAFVPMAGAVTIAELQAQINALMAQLAILQGSTVSTVTFTQNLTVGSRGTEVTALQQMLVAQGHLVMPTGVAMGYFGSLTKAAVAKWQTANGVSPTAGYWGPISRAKANTTTTTTTTTTTGGITTPGVEGTLTASETASPASGTKVYEGGSKVDVLGVKLEAKLSDVKVERIKLKLDAATSGNSDQQFYTKIADNIYVMDGSTVLASSSDYYITITGFSVVVPKGSSKSVTIAVDPKASWDSTYDNDSWTVSVPVDGVRGVDGAGINLYSPSTLFANNFTSAADVVDSASMTISLASGSPATSQVIANQGSSDNEYDLLPLAIFNFAAGKDNVKVTDLVVDLVRAGGNNVATATTAYIYDGSTLVGSATVAGTSATAASATFSSIDWVVPADTTKALTFKVDIDDAALAVDTYAVDIGVTTAVATRVTSENSAGTSITETGTAQGNTITIRKVGPEISLVSKSITTSGAPQVGGTTSGTSTLTATFNLKIKAVGGTLTLGTVASGTPVVASTTAGTLTGGSFHIYRNGAFDSTISSVATSTSYNVVSGNCTSAGVNSCTLSDGGEVSFPVTFSIQGRGPTTAGAALTSGLYAVGFEGIQWWNATSGAVQTTTFMAGDNGWRTADVSFP
ncbi:MAG: hypothetical protein UY20_C0019G0009 [Candidatus Yanofskybacteria bacterium GW2011_GWA1_48_10]|uniref:Peptidoglycan binding-like domain-containing protein n=1 Tax=Candidatus Yanofskybacteria bacterium GW2011_GWA1_48_10 TaxID=1619022 RepID=A0A0G1WF76_9BACT|nr:MAG: hypothetical protein UY20_C0019G0009 [Candidatus Yanofskybacteria bacterium GW2011_GWA1_48_10]